MVAIIRNWLNAETFHDSPRCLADPRNRRIDPPDLMIYEYRHILYTPPPLPPPRSHYTGPDLSAFDIFDI